MSIFLVVFAELFFVSFALMNYPEVTSCTQVYRTGIYTLNFNGLLADVVCDADSDWGGWTVVINRVGDNSTNFNEEWHILAHVGVGTPRADFMIPLEMLSAITTSEPHELLVEMSDGVHTGWAFYSYFQVLSQSQNFQLVVDNLSEESTAGDSLNTSNRTFFSTIDRDNDNAPHKHCAQQYHSPGWFNSCYQANPLGDYSETLQSIAWYSFNPNITRDTLQYLSFRIRPRRCVSREQGIQCTHCMPGYHAVRSNNNPDNWIVCMPLCTFANPSCAVCSYSLDCKECNSGYILSGRACILDLKGVNNFITISEEQDSNYIPYGLIIFLISIAPYLVMTCVCHASEYEASELNSCAKRIQAALLINECCYRGNSHKVFAALVPSSLMLQIMRVSLGLILFQMQGWETLFISIITSLMPIMYRFCFKTKIYSKKRKRELLKQESTVSLNLGDEKRTPQHKEEELDIEFTNIKDNTTRGTSGHTSEKKNSSMYKKGMICCTLMVALLVVSFVCLIYYIYFTRDLSLNAMDFWEVIVFSYSQQILEILIYALINGCRIRDVRLVFAEIQSQEEAKQSNQSLTRAVSPLDRLTSG